MSKDKIITLLGAALFISLSANLFMAGLMLGHSFTARPGVEAQGEMHAAWKKRDEALRKLLSPEDRAILKKEMQTHRGEFAALRRQISKAQEDVEKTLNAKPFDQKALSQAIDREREVKAQALAKMQDVREKIMQQVSPEGREILQKMGPFDRSRADVRRAEHRGGDAQRIPSATGAHLPESATPTP